MVRDRRHLVDDSISRRTRAGHRRQGPERCDAAPADLLTRPRCDVTLKEMANRALACMCIFDRTPGRCSRDFQNAREPGIP